MSLLVVALDEEELPVDGGKEVVHHDIHPGAILPELEVEDASVPLLVEALHSTSNILEERKSSVMEETSSMVAKRTLTWSLGTSSLKVWGTVAAPARAQRNQQSPSLRMMIIDHDDDANGDGDIAQPALVDIVLARALHHQLRLGEQDARAHPLDL